VNTPWARYFPWAVLAVAALYLGIAVTPPSDAEDALQIHEFGRLPIQEGGRIKPIDSLARTDLMILTGKQSLRDSRGSEVTPDEWSLDVMNLGAYFLTDGRAGSVEAASQPVFRIESDAVRNALGLPEREGLRYTYAEVAAKMDVVRKESDRARKLEPGQRELFDNKILELAGHVDTFHTLAGLDAVGMVPPEPGQGKWQPLAPALENGNADAQSYWVMLQAYAVATSRDERSSPTVRAQAVARFNDELAHYRERLEQARPAEVRRARLEANFNHFAPFFQCTVLYVCVFLMVCFGWMTFTGPLNRAAFMLGALTLAVHTGALLTRMYLQGRPPVTNLYSSAVFIGWGAVGLGLGMETIFKNGLANAVGSVIGFLTCIIAHYLQTTGDTLGMMEAVLDTNFWLATHVTCVTLGYTTTFVTGCFGMAWIVRRVIELWHPLDPGTDRVVTQMTYGTCCFATMLSFVGTVLGGIWADQSWGRFWGWDPKENGALLIVIWNALLLHARWGGMVKARGIACLAVFGNIVTSWSWFGTNMLGVGLHSYGFMEKAAWWLAAFMFSQLLFIGVALAPARWWRSLFGLVPPPPPDAVTRTPPPGAQTPLPSASGIQQGTEAIAPAPQLAQVGVQATPPTPQLPHRRGKGKRGRR